MQFVNDERWNQEPNDVIQLYRRYFGAINDYSRTRPNLHLQNFRVTNGELLQLLNDARLNDLFAQRDTVFSINASLGAILFNATENQYRYYRSSDNNSTLFPKPIQIRDEQSFQEFLRRLRDVDFVEKADEDRPDSKRGTLQSDKYHFILLSEQRISNT